MPSMLIATKKAADGTVIDRQVTPFNDYGNESLQAAAEEQRLKALGYETEIRRASSERTREGGELVT